MADGNSDGGPVIKPLEIGLWAALQGVWARQLGYSAGTTPIGSAASLVVSAAPVEGLMRRQVVAEYNSDVPSGTSIELVGNN